MERNGNGNQNFDARQVNIIALFCYSGHGRIDAIGGYLVTPDYSPGDPGVSLADVLAIASNSKSGGCERSLWRR